MCLYFFLFDPYESLGPKFLKKNRWFFGRFENIKIPFWDLLTFTEDAPTETPDALMAFSPDTSADSPKDATSDKDASSDAHAGVSKHCGRNLQILSTNSRFYCKVCNVQAQDQFEFKMHYTGMKHLKSMR